MTNSQSSSTSVNGRQSARLSGEIMTVEEVSELLKISESSVRRAVKAGTIPAVTIGVCIRFRRSDILAMFDRAAREVPGADGP